MSSTLHKIKDKLTGDTTSSTTAETQNTGASSNASSGYNTRSSGGHGHHTAHEEAPVVKERYHDDTEHVDKTQREEIHDQTKVNTVVQPIKDEQQHGVEHERRDHGTEVREHGRAGIDANAEAELRARREDIARQGGTEHFTTSGQSDERGETRVHEHTNTVEQVQPVIEKDVYRPHQIDHHKKEIDIHHEPTQVGSTQVAPTVTVDEYNNRR